jgi:tetratricopeptide (TPR) repeat protein
MTDAPAQVIARVNSLLANKKQAEAMKVAARAAADSPDDMQLLRLYGDLLMQVSRPVEAERCYRRLLEQNSQQADVLNRLAAVLQTQRRSDEAVQACLQALSLAPENPEIHANLGNIFSSLGRVADAEDCFQRAIRIAPTFLGAQLNLGNLYQAQQRFAEAEQCYLQVVQANPRFLEMYIGLAECCVGRGEPDRALQYYDKALSIDPAYLQAHLNRAAVCMLLGRCDDGLASLDLVQRLDPGHAGALFNRGLIFKRTGRYEQAAESFAAALESQPGNPDYQLSLSLLELLRGHYRTGWRLYAARKSVRDKGLLRYDSLPPDLSGRKVLLLKDQGLGDEIFFLRFAAGLKARNASITYQCDLKIRSLLEHVDVLDCVLPEGEPTGQADYTVSVGDLPFLLGFAEDDAHPQPLVLPVDRERVQPMRALLEQAGPPPWIGVTWWAGTRSPRYTLGDRLAFREIPLELLIDATRDHAGTFVVLQRSPCKEDLDWLRTKSGRPLLDASSLNDELEDMLALLGQLHEYIGIDNTNMHLAAGIGKACRILVPYPPEWRMQVSGAQSPWFPGFSLYREDASGDWCRAMTRLHADLQQVQGRKV